MRSLISSNATPMRPDIKTGLPPRNTAGEPPRRNGQPRQTARLGVIPTIPLLDPISTALDADLIIEIAPHAA